MKVYSSSKYHVLIVGSVTEEIQNIRDILHQKEISISFAQSGQDALACVVRKAPQLVLLESVLPDMDGFAVCKELQDTRWSKYKNMPILILTSVREDASRRRYELETGLELDVDDYVEKPMSPDVLLERVNTLIKKKKA